MANPTTPPTGRVLVGNALKRLQELPDASVHSVVTDPPYELGFMGKAWDASGIAYNVELWREVLRVLKPGGHLLAFGGTRTYHRMVVAIEDAGFEVRDSLHWTYGSGFPKSLDVSKALDKAAAAPATDDAKRWDGWGTALKPSHEPVVLARKPLQGTVVATVLEHGTGAVNVDGCRVGTGTGEVRTVTRPDITGGRMHAGAERGTVDLQVVDQGRWPANTLLTHSATCTATGTTTVTTNGHHPATRGKGGISTTGHAGQEGLQERKSGAETVTTYRCAVDCPVQELDGQDGGDTPSRFFPITSWDPLADVASFRYVAKPSKRERDAGLDDMDEQAWVQWQTGNGASGKPPSMSEGRDTKRRNTHPTVKPTELMRWLVRLVTPPGGTVLDPFLGSGTTAVAATLEGFSWVGCELTEAYVPIIDGRTAWAVAEVKRLETAPPSKPKRPRAPRRPRPSELPGQQTLWTPEG